MLQLRNAPRRPRENLLMAGTDQQHIRHDRNAKGAFDASFLRTDLVFTQPKVRLEPTVDLLDVIVTTHKTIALVFHTQVYKLKRNMTPQHSASAVSVAFMHNDGMEVHDESPAHSPTADCGRPTPVGAPPQGAHDHSGTPGGQSWK